MLLMVPVVIWTTLLFPRDDSKVPDPTGIEFDRRYSVDTCGIVRLSSIPVIKASWVYGFDYQAVEVFGLRDFLNEFSMLPEQSTFVDLGAGKGRAILMASMLPFRQVIGVELTEQLTSIARLNLEKISTRYQLAQECSVIHADAAEFEFPPGPLVIFLYNPFDYSIMEKVIENLLTAGRHDSRRALVIYFRPELRQMWEIVPQFRLLKSTERYCVFDYIS